MAKKENSSLLGKLGKFLKGLFINDAVHFLDPWHESSGKRYGYRYSKFDLDSEKYRRYSDHWN